MASSGNGASSSSSPSYSSLQCWWIYDVFISFRGEDTRKNFTDHLSAALDQKGIFIFRDDRNLQRGKAISLELLKAIEGSRFAVVILSKNYGCSSWCLDELLKIVECMEVMGQLVVPIFYDVNPTEVRKQTGNFEKAFAEHEKAYGTEKVQKWRTALTKVANLSGWDLQDKHEATFLQDIVKQIASKLSPCLSSVTKDLVGMDKRLRELDTCLGIGQDDVRFIGICGMGGIGKTTIANVIYHRLSYQFEGSCFLANVREESEKFGYAALQQNLLSQILVEKINVWDVHRGIDFLRKSMQKRKVLIILDDVDNLTQLESLAGEHGWFGLGSRIIITTRDEHLLTVHQVDVVVYNAETLDEEEALQLLCRKAFKQNHPLEDYVEHSKQIVQYASGLPLALKVLGSFLCGRNESQWRYTLAKLKEIPNKEILNILKISYDGLDEIEQNIFLDIACFFNISDLDEVTGILKACGFHPEIGISILKEKSLISIDENRLHVHDLLREMAVSIVHKESPKEPGGRCRLWLLDDICHVLSKKTGTIAVEVIYAQSFVSKVIYMDADAFLTMHNLRLLIIEDVHLPNGLHFLPNDLRILKWHGYPLKFLPPSFYPKKLFELDMSGSHIEQLWKGVVHLEKLEVLNLSYSQNLTRTPNFRGTPNLERLILEGCTNLFEVHPSVGDLKELTILNLRDCKKLQSLPSTISGWKSLKVLIISGCLKLNNLPENLGDSEYLEELDVSQTAIIEAPSVVHMKNLKKLSFQGCKRPTPWNWLKCLLPDVGPCYTSLVLPSLAGLRYLTELDLSDCHLAEGEIPSDLGDLSGLRTLNLSRNNFITLPASIGQLSKLQTLELKFCPRLQALPELPSSIENLCTYNCSSLEILASPMGLGLSDGREFSLNNCFRLSGKPGNSNVALSLLKFHLCMVVKVRLLSLLSKFLQWMDSQDINDTTLIMVANFVRRAVDILFQEITVIPSNTPRLVINLPGNEIPNWFVHQTTDSSLAMALPPCWYNDHTVLGLAICALFEVHDHLGDFGVQYVYNFKFYLVADDGNLIIFGQECSFNRDTLAVSDHLWVLFLPLDQYLYNVNWCRIEAYFQLEGPGFEFKKCGFRLVYTNDAELNHPTLFQGVDNSQMQAFNIQLDNYLQSVYGVPTNEPTQDVDDFNEMEESSGSATVIDETEPAESSSPQEAMPSGSDSCHKETNDAALSESVDSMLDPKGKHVLEELHS